MFLHLWGAGLRASEVCTLKGDAFYTQNGDTWMQVYQTKMKSYKRIPVPVALYLLMKVYIDKYEIKAEDYIFQNRKGGAYCYAAFRCRILKCCQENGIADGEYLFKSHDFRHTLATLFHDEGVSVQGIRDYLGHEYEEMKNEMEKFIRNQGNRRTLNLCTWSMEDIIICVGFCKKEHWDWKAFWREKEMWIHQLKVWMMAEGMPVTRSSVGLYGNKSVYKARLISYFEKILDFLMPEDSGDENNPYRFGKVSFDIGDDRQRIRIPEFERNDIKP